MDEHVVAAIVRLNEAEPLLSVVELYGARVHGDIFRWRSCTAARRQATTRLEASVVDVRRGSERAPGNREGETASFSGQMSMPTNITKARLLQAKIVPGDTGQAAELPYTPCLPQVDRRRRVGEWHF
jgi:hypothetical protein